MYAYQGMSYWDVYKLPVPIRRWLIKTYNKRMEQANKNTNSTEQPLSKLDKDRIRMQNQQSMNQPPKSIKK